MNRMQSWLDEETQDVIARLVKINECDSQEAPLCGFSMKERVSTLINHLQCALFPAVFDSSGTDEKYLGSIIQSHVSSAAALLDALLEHVLATLCIDGEGEKDCSLRSAAIAKSFIGELPKIRAALATDIQAAFDGDPAAKSKEEIVLSYPCFEAIMIYRLAHEFWVRDVPIIPRMMTELAHSHTGIDIHPGAGIGNSFFIDHGTGVVIGETTHIGSNVKLYQGVTLGAKSFLTDEKGTILAIKRHPNIEDNVVIYAHATILGGDTTVGHDSIIGGNVWLTSSVSPYSYVYNMTPHPEIKGNEKP
ncbi:MAG: serine acetyltransferase [Eubacteriaceae bacterium]|jgi:serine O-acetyltransferase|nr:serine acetyltransferase [Eubacteriaceae bacterium]